MAKEIGYIVNDLIRLESNDASTDQIEWFRRHYAEAWLRVPLEYQSSRATSSPWLPLHAK
jgi:hypothetical protein